MSMADTAQLAVDLNLKGVSAYTSGMASVARANSAAMGSAANLGKTLGKVGDHAAQGLGKAVKNLERMTVVAGGFALGGAAAAVKWAGDFEAQLNTINTIAFATPAALSKIGDGIRDISKKTGIATEDLTGAYYDLLSAGVKAKDAQSLLNNAVTLGIGGLATTKETVDLLTTAYNAYGLTAAGAQKATDQFAQAVADGKVTAAQIAESFANIASIAKTAGVGIDQVAAAYAFLTAQGVPAAEVTTEMQRAIVSLMKPLPELEKAQKKLGVTFTEEVRKKGLVPALQELRDYADKNKIPLLELLGRIEAVKFVLQTTGPNAKGFAKELDNITDSAGMAAKQMAERQQGLNYQLDVLKANVKDAGITIGSALIPPLVELSKDLTAFLQGHQPEIKAFGQNLARAFKDGVTWAKSLDWKAIGSALKTAAGAAKGLVDAFMTAPAWLQQAVVTGWGLNKLTGGALSNIGGDIAKGIAGSLGSRFLDRGSSAANPLWVQSVGGIGGPGGGPGGLGIASILGTLGIVTLIQGLFNQSLPNGGQPYNVPTTTPLPGGPQLIDVDATAAKSRANGGTLLDQIFGSKATAPPPGTGGMSPDDRQAFNDAFQSHSEDRKLQMASIDAIRANTVALAVNAKSIEEAWLKTIDPDKIGDRSKAKSGRDATPAQIAAIRSRDILHHLEVITEKSKASSDIKLARLQALAQDAKATGDTKTAAKVKTAIAEMKAKIAAEQTKTTSAVTTGTQTLDQAIAAANQQINVYVTTNVTASDIVTTTVKKDRMGAGPGSSNNKGTSGGGVL